jgi:hypothetical protein
VSGLGPTPEERFDRLVGELIDRPGVSYGKDEPGTANRFGSNALKIGGKIFAMLVRGALVVKLPRGRVDELVGAGQGVRFDPRGGRPMTEWLVLDPDSQLSWPPLAAEAMQFVAPKTKPGAAQKAKSGTAAKSRSSTAPKAKQSKA